MIRQLVTESVTLAIPGGVLGLILGITGIRALLAFAPGKLPRIGDHGAAVVMDWRVLAFTIAVTLITGILFGLIPALRASHTDLSCALKKGSARIRNDFRHNRGRSLLVVVETALALILLIGSALLIRTLIALHSVDPGFDARNVASMQMTLGESRFESASAVDRLVRDGLQRIAALPGISAAASTWTLPLQTPSNLPFIIVGRPLNGSSHGFAHWANISQGYFDVFKIPILRGRAFTDQDNRASPGVAVINQAMARRFWPKGDPLNQRLVIGKGVGPAFEEPARQIIGIVGDVRYDGLNRNPSPMMYVPEAQVPDGFNALLTCIAPIIWIVRIRGESQSLRSSIENELRQASGGIPVGEMRPMDEIVKQSTARQRFMMLLSTIFACCALLLSAIGIYGSMAYSVQQRMREMGIRLALGAYPSDIRNMIISQGMRLAFSGIVIGTVAALGLARLIATLLFGVKSWDPLVFTIVPVLLSAVALFAVWLPARRASRIDPAHALRSD